MKVKIPHKNANVAHTLTDLEAHQRFGHPGKEVTRATSTKLSWKQILKTQQCEACLIRKACQKT